MRRWGKFLHLSRRDRQLVLQAALQLVWVRATLRGKVHVALHALEATPPRPPLEGAQSSDRVAWAVATASRYVPGATCLVQALAARALLRRAGQPVTLRLGVAKPGPAHLEAHAWLEGGGRVLYGRADVAGRYQPLPVPPGGSS